MRSHTLAALICAAVSGIAVSGIVTPGFVETGVLFAQQVATHKDLAYDDEDPAQKLDVYLAKSDKPTPAMVYIHGGGWRAGSKNQIPGWLRSAVKEGSLSVVSVEYRFTNVAPHPAQVNDCMRAIQFVRHNAKKWNIDPQAIGATGGSAGGHLSLWVALHDDVANAKSKDAVERYSSRVACAVSFAGPTDWSLLGKIKHDHPAYRQLLGYEPGTPAEDMSKEKMTDVSPISFASEDDPPVLLVHGDKDFIVPIQHAIDLDKRLKKLGSESELMVVPGAGHGVAGANAEVSTRSSEFVRKNLALSP
ncbi:MAG: acetyl esterase/lipase [Pirellulaceae bacterium]|jgi:acetyl esterase/lipase